MTTAWARAPTIEDARRAAAALVDAGVGEVWLYGSVARGESRHSSDIDLVAVLDDLDYRRRFTVTHELQEAARRACGRNVEVLVTDQPEWRIQRVQVPASFASAISDDLMLLASSPMARSGVDWDKEQVMATSDGELSVERLDAVLLNLDKIGPNVEPGWAERDLIDSDDRVERARVRGARLIAVCEAAHLAIENAAKTLAAISGVEAKTLWSHDVAKIVGSLDDRDTDAVEAMLAAAPELVKSPDYITMWRTRGAYGGPSEGITAQEVATPAFTTALATIACDVAVYAAETLARLGRGPHVTEPLRRRAAATRKRLADFDIATGEPASG